MRASSLTGSWLQVAASSLCPLYVSLRVRVPFHVPLHNPPQSCYAALGSHWLSCCPSRAARDPPLAICAAHG